MTGRWKESLKWNCSNVSTWLAGLESSICNYASAFVQANIDGSQLLNMTSDDLVKLGVVKVGHQQLIMSAIDQLIQLHYDLEQETLQRIILRCATCASTVHNAVNSGIRLAKPENSFYVQIKRDQERAHNFLLGAFLTLMRAVKHALFWLDRPPFNGLAETIKLRQILTTQSLQLNVKIQIYVSKGIGLEDLAVSSMELTCLCDSFVKHCKDILIMTPCTLESLHIQKQEKKDLGFNIHSTYNNTHVINALVVNSAAYLTGRVAEGDEVIQVNNQTVVAWRHQAVVDAMRTERSEVQLLLRKRPAHPLDSNSQLLSAIRRRPNPLPNAGGMATFSRQFWRPRRARGGGHKLMPDDVENSVCLGSGGGNSLIVTPQHVSTLTGAEDVFEVSSRSCDHQSTPRLRLSTYDGTEVQPVECDADLMLWSGCQNRVTHSLVNHPSNPTITVSLSSLEGPDNAVGMTNIEIGEQTVSRAKSGSVMSLTSQTSSSTLGSVSHVRMRGQRALGSSESKARRISCRDLGQGDCHGWLLMKKCSRKLGRTSWVKRYAILKHNCLYYYKDIESQRAEGLIQMPSLTVVHVPLVRQKRFAFRVYNDYVTFTFACESDQDRVKWMNKLQLCSIGFKWDNDLEATEVTVAGFAAPYTRGAPPPFVPGTEPMIDEPSSSRTTNPTLSAPAPVYSESESDEGDFGGEPDDYESSLEFQSRRFALGRRRAALERELRRREDALNLIDQFLSVDSLTSDQLYNFIQDYENEIGLKNVESTS